MPNDLAVSQSVEHMPDLKIPKHLGVIMDGNGRWAKARGKVRTEGHREGIRSLKNLVALCSEYQVDYLTVFSFSSENWNRPKSEIEFIFSLLHRFVEADLRDLKHNNVKVRILGDRSNLDGALLRTIKRVEDETRLNTGLNLNVAFNYGGKAEIIETARALADDVANGRLAADEICEDLFDSRLYTGGMPPLDLLVRTGGEQRISNFLIWQAAYAELVFLDTYWPDFCEADFVDALTQFSSRDRRFGGLGVSENGGGVSS